MTKTTISRIKKPRFFWFHKLIGTKKYSKYFFDCYWAKIKTGFRALEWRSPPVIIDRHYIIKGMKNELLP